MVAESGPQRETGQQRAARLAATRAAAQRQKRQRLLIGASVAAVLALAGIALAVTASRDDGGTTDQLAASSAPTPTPADPAPADPTPAEPTPAQPTSPQPTAAPGTCSYPPSTSGPAARPATPPPANPGKPGPLTATMVTDQGTVAFQLLAAKAPCTVSSLRSLAAAKYFDNTPCHRLTTMGIFVLQCGDPTGQGSGGPGYQFAEENLTGATYPRGTVAMARAGPGTNGSQFFLVYQDSPLPPEYTPFGRITAGLDVLDKVAAAGAGPSGDGPPNLPVTVKTLRVTAG